MENLLPLVIQLVSGAVGGNAAGSLMKKLSLGTLWNSVLGIIGGGLGGQLMGILGLGIGGNATDLNGIIGNVIGGGVGGGALMGIIGFVKKMIKK